MGVTYACKVSKLVKIVKHNIQVRKTNQPLLIKNGKKKKIEACMLVTKKAERICVGL